MDHTSELVVERGEVTTVRLNRPARSNSVTPEVMDTLARVMAELSASADVTAIVLTGTGSSFCSGADIKEMGAIAARDGIAGLTDYLGTSWMPSVQQAIRAVWHCRKPIVAAVNGSATAGGLDLASATDARVALESARLGESYILLGMVPVGAGTFFMRQRATSATALRLLLTGELISAREGLQAGLVDEVVTDNAALLGRAHELAASLAAAPGPSVAAMKTLLHRDLDAQFESTLAASLAANIALLRESSVRSRLQGVLDKFSDR